MRSVRWAGSIKETEEPWQEGQEVTAAVTSESHQLGLAVWRLEVILVICWTGNRADKRVTVDQEGMLGKD